MRHEADEEVYAFRRALLAEAEDAALLEEEELEDEERPWQGVGAAVAEAVAELAENQGADKNRPVCRLDFYSWDVILTKWEGGMETSQPISMEDLAAVFSGLTAYSGTLPRNTVFWRQVGSVIQIGIYIPPAKYNLSWDGERYNLPMPGFFLIGADKEYHLYAVKEYPTEETPLYYPPTPNIYPNSSICQGNVAFPACSAATIEAAWQLFIKSDFSPHLANGRCESYPESVGELWLALDGKDDFPLDELVLANRN